MSNITITVDETTVLEIPLAGYSGPNITMDIPGTNITLKNVRLVTIVGGMEEG